MRPNIRNILFHKPNIVTNGLVLNLDAGNPLSYLGSGTTWIDLSGFGNNGTLVDGTGYTTENGGSLTFDGINDGVDFNNNSQIQRQDFTISVWIYPVGAANNAIKAILDFDHATTPAQGWVIQSENANTGRNYYLAYFSSSSILNSNQVGSGLGIQTTNDAWQNLTYVKQGTSIVGYKNGLSTFTPPNNSNAFVSYTNSHALKLGGVIDSSYSVGRFMSARVPILNIYNRGLTAPEVLQNYNNLRGRFGV